MKKLFTVLAVLLVASVAFASVIKGNVSAEYKFDFDAKTIEYKAPGVGSLDATLNFDPTEAIIIGDAEATHIEAKVLASADLMINKGNSHADGYKPFKAGKGYFWYDANDFTYDGKTTTLWAAITFKVDTFKIVAKNWSVDFVNGLDLDFAKSAIDSERYHKNKAEDNTQYYNLDNSLSDDHNLTVEAYGYSVGFGFGTGDETWDKELNFALSAKTPEYEFSGVKLQAGAGYQVAQQVWSFAGSVTASYATDKVSVSGAYDAIYENEEQFVENELALKVAVAPVAVDVYYVNDGARVKDKYADFFPATGLIIAPTNYLSAKVVVDVAKVAENVPVKVTLTGKNLLNEETQILDAAAETTIVPNFKFGVYFKDWFDFATAEDASGKSGSHRKLGGTVEFTGVQNLTLNGELSYAFAKDDEAKKFFGLVGAKYAHELFTASAEIAMEKVYDKDAKFGADAKVTSTKLVDGAELSAKAIFNLNNVSTIKDTGTGNSLTLACKVTF